MSINCKKCGKKLSITNTILNVNPESAAEKLGIAKGDTLIAIDGKVINQSNETSKIVNSFIFHEIKVKRSEKELSFFIENLKSLFESVTFKDNTVIVQSITKDSNAEKLGLLINDQIIVIDNINITNIDEIKKFYMHSISVKRQETLLTVFVEDINAAIESIKFKDKSLNIEELKNDSELTKQGVAPDDVLCFIDFTEISKEEDISNALKPKEVIIELTNNGENKKVKTSAVSEVLKNITFKPEEICSACGAKQSKSIIPLLIILGSLIIIGVIIGIMLGKGNKKADVTSDDTITPIHKENLVEKQNDVSVTISEVLSKQTIDLLEKNMKEISPNTITEKNDESEETRNRKRAGSNRSEVFLAYDESGNVLNLRDTYLSNVNLNDGITFSSGSRNEIGEPENKETKTRTRRASNRDQKDYDSVESTLNTITELRDTIIEMADISDISEKIMGRLYFEYGSSLDPSNMNLSIEKYLLIKKESEELKEYSSIVLGLNDLISKIPEEKKDSAVFILMGYADSTLFNAVPEISERSNKFNTELSLKRAETVKAILKGESFGIASNKIITQALGYSKNEEAVSDLWKYRRVDIVISYE